MERRCRRMFCLMVLIFATSTPTIVMPQDLWPMDGDVRSLVVPEGWQGDFFHLNYRANYGWTHFGSDLWAGSGDCIRAAADGIVEVATFHPTLGNYVIIRHDGISRRGESTITCPLGTILTREDKSTEPMRTMYLHLLSIDVAVGDEVAMGEKIGEVGQTGTASGGVDHVHFEMRYFPGNYGSQTACSTGNNIYHCADARCLQWAADDWEDPAAYNFSSIIIEDSLNLYSGINESPEVDFEFEVTGDLFDLDNLPEAPVSNFSIYRPGERDSGLNFETLNVERLGNRRFRVIASSLQDGDFNPGEMLNLRFELDNGTWQLPAFAKKSVYLLDSSDFDDTEDGSWYASWVTDGVRLGLFKGTGRNYRPGDDLNRGEMAKVVLSTSYKVQRQDVVVPGGDVDISQGEAYFLDVPPCADYFTYVQSLKNSEVVVGYPANGGRNFFPFNAITRGELSKFLVEAMAIQRGDHPGRDLDDLVDSNPNASPDDETWATYYMQTLYHEGRIDGKPNPNGNGICLCPNIGVSRAEMAKFMVNAYKYKIGGNDPGEDNDVIERATPLQTGQMPLVAHGVLFPDTDEDWYSFAVDQAGAIEVRYSPISDLSRPAQLEVYGPADGAEAGPRLTLVLDANSGIDLVANLNVATPGAYHAHVLPLPLEFARFSSGSRKNAATDSYVLTISTPGDPPSTTVRVDVKPGSIDNPFNPRSQGKTPVAIISTPLFDAPQMVDAATLTFGRTGAEASLHFRGNSLPNCSPSDVNGDGLVDLFCRFMTQMTGILQGDTRAVLRGKTFDGQVFEGFDAITIVGFKDDADSDGVGDKEEVKTPNAGDGNGDGIADIYQANITSLRSKETGRFITLEADASCISTDARSIPNFELPDDPEYALRQGALEFQLTGVAAAGCSRSKVTLIFHGENNLNGAVYRKFVGTQWSTFPATFGQRIIGGKTVATAELFLVDGGPGDGDGLVDGVITDPGGPAYPLAVGAIPTQGTLGLALLALLLALIGITVVRRMGA